MTDDTVEQELRAQLLEVFSNADYPVTGQMELVPVLPDGPATTFEVGDRTVSAMSMAAKLADHQDFPYETVESLVDDVVAAMRDEGMV